MLDQDAAQYDRRRYWDVSGSNPIPQVPGDLTDINLIMRTGWPDGCGPIATLSDSTRYVPSPGLKYNIESNYHISWQGYGVTGNHPTRGKIDQITLGEDKDTGFAEIQAKTLSCGGVYFHFGVDPETEFNNTIHYDDYNNFTQQRYESIEFAHLESVPDKPDGTGFNFASWNDYQTYLTGAPLCNQGYDSGDHPAPSTYAAVTFVAKETDIPAVVPGVTGRTVPFDKTQVSLSEQWEAYFQQQTGVTAVRWELLEPNGTSAIEILVNRQGMWVDTGSSVNRYGVLNVSTDTLRSQYYLVTGSAWPPLARTNSTKVTTRMSTPQTYVSRSAGHWRKRKTPAPFTSMRLAESTVNEFIDETGDELQAATIIGGLLSGAGSAASTIGERKHEKNMAKINTDNASRLLQEGGKIKGALLDKTLLNAKLGMANQRVLQKRDLDNSRVMQQVDWANRRSMQNRTLAQRGMQATAGVGNRG